MEQAYFLACDWERNIRLSIVTAILDWVGRGIPHPYLVVILTSSAPHPFFTSSLAQASSTLSIHFGGSTRSPEDKMILAVSKFFYSFLFWLIFLILRFASKALLTVDSNGN